MYQKLIINVDFGDQYIIFTSYKNACDLKYVKIMCKSHELRSIMLKSHGKTLILNAHIQELPCEINFVDPAMP